jgi:GT2 family glycosyltransferase
MKVLAIIVSYNFERWITPCLNSLRASEQPVSILVVDNHSTDHTVERIKAEYPEAQLIENKENLGFGAAIHIIQRI